MMHLFSHRSRYRLPPLSPRIFSIGLITMLAACSGGGGDTDTPNEPPTNHDTSAPTAPSSLTSSEVQANQLQLNWAASSDNVAVSRYQIYRDSTAISSTTNTYYIDTGLQPDTEYQYYIVARDAAQNTSNQSSSLRVTTVASPPDQEAPTVPTGLQVTNINSTEVTLAWQAATDNVATTGYRIYRDGLVVGTTAVLFFTDTELQPVQTYQYTLEAYDAEGNSSAASTSVDATTLAVNTEITANIKASRTSGVSPLAVVFSAELTTANGLTQAQVFSDIGYHFNFSDSDTSTHATTGLTKNTQIGGPLATHVFECATGQCVFTVGVRAQNTAGDHDDDFVVITVDSATHRYTAANTVCVSSTSNWSGDQPCPAGATQTLALPNNDAYSNKRILLRRGETFSDMCLAYGTENVLIEPFGNDADAQPIFPAGVTVSFGVNTNCGSYNVTTSQAEAINAAGPWLKDITLHSMRVSRILYGMSYEHVSVHNIDSDFETDPSTGGLISLSSNTGRCYKSTSLDCAEVPFPKGAYVTDSVFIGSEAASISGSVGVNIGAFDCPVINWMGIMGNTFRTAYEHNYRSQGQWRANFSHNQLLGHHKHNSGKSRLTLRGCGINDVDPENQRRDITGPWENINLIGDGPVSKYLVVADNLLGSTDSGTSDAYKGGMSPQNTQSMEGLELGLWERNTFINSATDISNDLLLIGKDLTARTNNIYSTGASNCYGNINSYNLPIEFANDANCEGVVPPIPLAPSQ